MPGSTPMSVQDALWLTMDRPNNLMVVDGAMVLARVPDLEAVRAVFREAVHRFPVLGRRAVRRGVGWAWQDDPDFDLDRHVTAVALPEPRDMAAVQRYVAEQRAVPLERDRPLWHAFLVTGLRLDDDREGAALVTRFHHSIADGVRLTQVMLGMLEHDDENDAAAVGPGVAARPGGTGIGVPGDDSPAEGGLRDAVRATLSEVAGNLTAAAVDVAHVARGVSSAAASAAEDLVETLGAAAGAAAGAAGAAVTGALADPQGTLAAAPGAAAAVPGRTVSAAADLARAGVHGVEEGFDLMRHPDRLLDVLEAFGVEDSRTANDLSAVTKLTFAGTPPTVWSGEPGLAKAMSWSRPLPLEGIKAVGRAHRATVNDVMLAAVAGGLHRYLTARGGEADEVLWMVPVNLKPFEDNLPPDLGNYFALVWLAMPLGIADPVARLREMHHRMDRIKHSDEKVITFGLQRLVSQSPGRLGYALTNFFANKAVGVLTNVPGPLGPMTFAGVPVQQVVGFAPCSGDNPMTATIFSYDGAVTVGFATDAGLVPDPGELCRLVVDELESMQASVVPTRKAVRRRARPARSDR